MIEPTRVRLVPNDRHQRGNVDVVETETGRRIGVNLTLGAARQGATDGTWVLTSADDRAWVLGRF